MFNEGEGKLKRVCQLGAWMGADEIVNEILIFADSTYLLEFFCKFFVYRKGRLVHDFQDPIHGMFRRHFHLSAYVMLTDVLKVFLCAPAGKEGAADI